MNANSSVERRRFIGSAVPHSGARQAEKCRRNGALTVFECQFQPFKGGREQEELRSLHARPFIIFRFIELPTHSIGGLSPCTVYEMCMCAREKEWIADKNSGANGSRNIYQATSESPERNGITNVSENINFTVGDRRLQYQSSFPTYISMKAHL